MDLIDHTMYNIPNEGLLLRLVSQKLQRLSKSKIREDCVLFPSMQTSVEFNPGGLLAWEEDARLSKGKHAKKPCGCTRQAKWTLEGWTKSGQVRIHFNSLTNASELRWGWICKGTPFGSGKGNRQIFGDSRSNTSH